MSDTLLLAIVTIVASGGFATIAVKLMERRKTSADAGLAEAQTTDVLVSAGERTVGILEAQLDRAIKQIDELRELVTNLEVEAKIKDTRIHELEMRVRQLER